MNLRAVANAVTQVINPNVQFTIKSSTGSSVNPDYSRTPTYTSVTAFGQMQALSNKDLRQLEGINQGGEMRVIYFYGDVEAVVRALSKGGDLVVDPSNNTWLVNQVMETWPDWCKVAVTLQNGG